MKSTATVAPRDTAAATLLWCVAGMLVPRATLLGALSPFGIGLAACGSAANLPTLLSVTIGYLLAAPVLSPLRYVAAVGLVAGGRWILDVLPESRHQPFVPPLLAFVACTATGMMTLLGGGVDGYRTLLILAESAVATGSSLCFDTTMRLTRHPHPSVGAAGQAAVVAVAAIAVGAAATIEVGGFAPGRVVAAWCVLVGAQLAREGGGCTAGCVLGGALALTSPTGMTMAIALPFGGLVAGVFSRFGRVVQGLLFLVGAMLITLSHTDEGVLMLGYELFCGVVLFALLPSWQTTRLSHLLTGKRDLPAAEGVRRMTALRLQVAGDAIEEVGRSVEIVSQRLARHGAADLASLYRSCAHTACEACPMHGVCWHLHQEDTLAALDALTPLLRQSGQVTAADVALPISCRRADRLAEYLTRGYDAYLAREEAWSRLRDIQQAIRRQLGGTGALLQGVAGGLRDAHRVDIELSEKVLEVCEDYGLSAEEALCARDERGRLTVYLLTATANLPEGRWHRRLAQVCGCALTPPAVTVWGDRVRITLTEPPRYAVEQGVAQRSCPGETLCGDTVQLCPLNGGVLAVLSDGMGCGGQAAVDSAIAAGITQRLWQADFTPDAILQTVEAALLVKSRTESLATLDVAMLDTHTGRLDLYKAGAATTLLCSQGRVSRLESTSLPVGILPEVTFAHSHDTLSEGDVLVMLSDGALCGGVAAVEELLGDYPTEGSMADLAQAVVDAAAAAEGEHPDDITVVAMRLCRTEEE